MHFDMSQAWTTVQRLINGFIAALPRFVVAVVVFALFYGIAHVVRGMVRKHARRKGEERTLELALARLSFAGILLLGLLFAAAAAFPDFTPADLVGALGIGSVAIGFAFKDIFQNFLAGILILITRPFRIGDQIVFKDYEGTVEEIQARATLLKTYDGRRVVLPNGDLYMNAVTVNTAFPTRRFEYNVGIGYGDDIERAKQIMVDVMVKAEGVLPDPNVDVIVVELGESSVNLRARWWSESRIPDALIAQDRVLSAMKRELQANGIDLPYPTRQILLHDQTETTDGDRRRQREGWPAGNGEVPGPRRSTETEASRH